jgi:hypothetical protein
MPPLASMKSEERASQLKIFSGNVPDISGTFKFPFGCPITSIETEDKDHHYSTNSGTQPSTTLSSEPSPSFPVSCH